MTKIALVHDYLNEAGGAERVLRTLSDMYPEAPIYTAFAVPGSSAAKMFADRRIVTSWFQNIPVFNKLYSPLRFIIPWIWGSFDFSEYDLVITSASWYVTKGMKRGKAKEICYCHTPPRWLYGYETSVNWQKYWPVRVYGLIVGHFLRQYDYKQAQKVDVFIANSKNVADRIRKFYRKEAEVVYPPVSVPHPNPSPNLGEGHKEDYFLMVTRVVGGKGIELALEAAKKIGFKLVIAGERAGYSKFSITNDQLPNNIQFLGRVSEEEKYKLMAGAKAFLALSKDEDFGITLVEAQMCGTPVIAFNGGGYRETVVNPSAGSGQAIGVLFDDYSAEGLVGAITEFDKLKWDRKEITKNGEKFSEEVFKRRIKELIAKHA